MIAVISTNHSVYYVSTFSSEHVFAYIFCTLHFVRKITMEICIRRVEFFRSSNVRLRNLMEILRNWRNIADYHRGAKLTSSDYICSKRRTTYLQLSLGAINEKCWKYKYKLKIIHIIKPQTTYNSELHKNR